MEHKVTKFDKWDVVCEVYGSTSELLTTCESRTKISGFTKDSFGGKEDRDDSWTGCKGGMKTAREYMEYGWSQDLDKVMASVHDTKRKLDDEKLRKLKPDVAGFTPIIPNAINGLPNSMLNMEKKPIKNKVIDLLYDGTFSCGTSADDILKTGMKMLSYVVKLEHSGFRVRLSAVNAYTDSKNVFNLVVKVKSENQPLDLKRCMFPMMHPGFFRLISFGWYERCPDVHYMDGYGHTITCEMNDEMQDKYAREVLSKTATYVHGTSLMDKGDEYMQKKLKGLAV